MRRVFALFLSLLMLSSSGLLDIVAFATGLGQDRETTGQEVVGDTVSIPVGEIEVEGTEPEKLEAAVYAAKVLDEETMLLYAAIDSETCQIMGYSGEETNLVIPSALGGLTVTAIGNRAFSNSKLESVTLPDTLTYIGQSAFAECKNLTSVRIPDSVTQIDFGAFTHCLNLEDVQLSSQLAYIGRSAFENCEKLECVEIPDTVSEIGFAAFMDCASLSSVTYPVNLQKTGSHIFADCPALKEIEVPEGVTYLPDDVFNGSTLQTVKLPSTLVTIGDQAFFECANLSAIELPNSVTTIGYRSFEKCTGLETVKLSEQLLSIGQSAFHNCINLNSIELPDSLTNIGYAAFQNCTALSSVKYPLGLESASTIFTGCTALKHIEVPEGVTALPADVFSDSSLETVKLPSTLVTIGNSAFKICRDLVSIEIPDSVTSIGRDAFADCGNLQNLKLSQQLLYIGQSAFGDCRKLESVEIPDSVTNIGYSAFQYCTALSSVKYPLGLQSAGGAIFAGCTSLKHIEVPEGVTVLPGDVFSASELETVKLPSTLVTIGSSAFEGSRKLVSIEIPDSVTSIGYKSFCDCANLKSVKLPQQLLTIGQSAFDDCRSLESISIPEGVTSIGYAAFRTCMSLTSANYPGSLQSTGGSVFHDCFSLKYMEFGEGLTSIGGGEFAYCYSLETVLLPDSVRSIGRDAFTGCRNLRAIGLSQNLNSIDREAFEGCLSLTDVTVPNSVTSIGREAFAGVPGLVFYCDLQSYAAAYAVENGIPIVEIAASQESPNAVLDKANSYYEINYGGISASGDLSMVAKYQLKDGADANPDQMIFYFPQSVKLKEETLTVNGDPCVSFTFEEDEGLLYVPISGSEGIVRFMLEPVRYDTVTAYAKLRYSGNGRYNTEVVGTVYTELNLLNISAMSQTAQNFVNVSGVAAPEAEIRLYVDGVYTKSVKANKVGDYNTTVTLPDPSDGKQYTITASTDGISDQLYAVTTVKYYTDTPTMTDFVMEYNGNTYSMEELNGKKPVVRFDTREKFKFTIRFDGVSNIDRLWVVSTRSNQEKAIEAKWDPAINAYVAEGWFDPDDHTYVPGKISIRMSRKSDKLNFDSEIDFTADKYVNQLTSDWQGATAELIENSETGSTVHIQLDGLELDLSTNVRPIPEGMTQVSLEREGYIRYEDENGYAVYVRTYDKPDEAGMVVVDFVKGQITDYFVGQVIESAVGGTVGGVISLLQGQKALEKANQEFKLMRQDIMNNPNLSDFEKRIAIQRVNDAETINTLAAYGQFTCTFLGIVGGIVGMSTGVGIALVVGGLIFSAIQTQNQHKMNTFMYNLQFGLRFAIDPSGYVYDSKTKQRLPGVTTTAYWIPFDEEVENFWDAVPEPDVYGEVWDATEFSQINPMTTDNDGCYAWDVPEGWWRVKYEKEGYETTWSEWLPVPPPQTEVNIGMVCLNAAVTMLGDVDLDEDVDVDDVLALLWYVLFPEEYPIAVDADFDHNESTDVDDVLTLLWYVLFPQEYPLT